MSEHIAIPDRWRQFIENIINKNGLNSTAKIEYGLGSESGDGFMSKTVTVDAIDEEKSLNLFCKYPLGLSWHSILPIDEMSANERYFYNTIYPAYQEFLKEKEVIFDNVPQCYGIDGDFIVLDNLKRKGFELFSGGVTMNEDHIRLTLKTLGNFHAISYAFKDQRREFWDVFVQNIHCNSFTDLLIKKGMHKVLPIQIRRVLDRLDLAEDENLRDASTNLKKDLVDMIVNVDKYTVDYPVIIQGDCWFNNVMYLYDAEYRTTPIDVKLIDWQVIRLGSPALDIAYFFYPVSSESTIDNLDCYLDVYYNEFCKMVRRLGSNPEILYPFSALQKDWKTFAKYSFALCFFNMLALLMEKEEMPNLEDHPDIIEQFLLGEDSAEIVKSKMKNEDLYLSRMRAILKHFVEHDFL